MLGLISPLLLHRSPERFGQLLLHQPLERLDLVVDDGHVAQNNRPDLGLKKAEHQSEAKLYFMYLGPRS